MICLSCQSAINSWCYDVCNVISFKAISQVLVPEVWYKCVLVSNRIYWLCISFILLRVSLETNMQCALVSSWRHVTWQTIMCNLFYRLWSYLDMSSGCGGWLWVLCTAAATDHIFCTKLLWRVWQCWCNAECRWYIDMLLSDPKGIREKRETRIWIW